MPTLKDDFMADLDEVFFNLDEFSEKITITNLDTNDSYTFLGQIDHIEKDLKEPIYGEEVFQAVETALYFKYKDGLVLGNGENFFDRLRSGKSIGVNNSQYTVNQTFVEEKLFIIRLNDVVGP